MENKKVIGQMTKEEAKALVKDFRENKLETVLSGLIHSELYKIINIKNRNVLLLEIEAKIREFHKFNNEKLELNDVLSILSDLII